MRGNDNYISVIRDKNNKRRVTGYRVQIRYFSNGQRKKYTKYFAVKDSRLKNAVHYSAREHRDKMLHDFSEIGFEVGNLPQKTTVQDLFDKLPSYYSRTKKTYANITARYNKHIGKEYGDMDIFSIKETDITASLKLCAETCVDSSVQQVFQIWKRIFKIAEKEGLPVKNITSDLEVPKSYKVTKRSGEYWNITEEDFQDFCEYFLYYGRYHDWEKDKIYKRQILLYLLKFMRITGLRPREAKAVMKNDFSKTIVTFRDQVTGEMITTDCIYVRIYQSIGSTATEDLTFTKTKTPNSNRAIPILRQWDRDLVEEILRFSKHECIFSDYYGNLISSKDVADYIGRVRKSYNKAKNKNLDVYAYLMRKSLGSDAEKSGTAAARKKIMGHGSEYTAGKWYSSASDGDVLSTMWNREYEHIEK